MAEISQKVNTQKLRVQYFSTLHHHILNWKITQKCYHLMDLKLDVGQNI